VTVAAAFHAGDFIFFVADNRETLPASTDGPAFLDSIEKVVDVQFGLTAFAGNAGLGRFGSYLIGRYNHPDGVRPAILKALEAISADKPPEVMKQALEDTTWLVSHRTADGLVLSMFDKSRSHAAWPTKLGEFFFIPPLGMSDADMYDINDGLGADFRKALLIGGPPPVRFPLLARMAEGLVKKSSDLCMTVAPTFQFGLHLASGAKHVSEFMLAANDCKWRTATPDQ
jgi:hypothetical protein